ncbi:adenine phosphoribosyltransferase [Methylobacillus rhizosphaerae]|uniref:Adenine phosphoribosyltransferase n=1 Tax=Methylobacillus rhizosphaerae TaxID=551994 RepID=A0A238XUY6_9PROT|nr:adenine phosphoribosyltransferase [Methylobacillus rhizosphaerae]SNR62134.1 adenine phosphoribosyltransferase [Methylobacillus rhizosphaerae]
MTIKSLIRTIPDYPKPGVQFRDITTLLKDADGLRQVVDALVERYADANIDKVVGIESRGFIVGAAVAYKLGVGFVPVRKKGKLPGDVLGHDYALEYGTDRVEIHSDAICPDETVLLLDDLIATGGTAEAAAVLIEKLGGQVLECAFIVGLPDLGGQQRLQALGYKTFTLCEFEGE